MRNEPFGKRSHSPICTDWYTPKPVIASSKEMTFIHELTPQHPEVQPTTGNKQKERNVICLCPLRDEHGELTGEYCNELFRLPVNSRSGSHTVYQTSKVSNHNKNGSHKYMYQHGPLARTVSPNAGEGTGRGPIGPP